ncbi:MAG: cellulase family glycosylhydrolase [Bacteroidales bacterium]
MMRIFIHFTSLFLLLPLLLDAQITPAEAVSQMGRGINLGNTLEPPMEGDWNNPKAQESYFDAYTEAGFKTVRIPVTWDKHTGTTAPYTVDAAWLNRVEEVVDWGLNRDMFVIINAHHEDWLKEDFGNPDVRERFDSIWSQVSVHFRGKSEKLFFEMLNEPRTSDHEGLTQLQIDEANSRLLGIIRKDHPARIVVYSGKGWAGSGDMMAAAVPDDPYIMAYFHSYDPWNFAGESQGTWGTTADRNAIYSKFSQVRSWADQNQVEVLLGEFGAMWDCDYNSRMLHYATYVRGCLANHFAFTVWDDGGWFEVLHRSDHTWQDSKDILVHTTLQSPDNLVLSVVNDTSVQIRWKPGNEPCDTILIERRVNNSAFIPLAWTHPDATTYLDTLTENLTDYTYRVIAVTDTISSYSYPSKISLQFSIKAPFSGSFIKLPGTIEAEDFDFGGEGLSYHETSVENITGAYRPDEGVDIEAGAGGFQVTNFEPGEWMEYSVDVAEAGTYEITTSLASFDGGGQFRFLFDGKVASTVTSPKTGGWNTMTDVSVRAELQAGEQIMRVLMLKRPPFNLDKFVISNVTAMQQHEAGGVRLYPNPAGEKLFIASDLSLTGASLSIFNAGGILVKQVECPSPEAGLDVSDLAGGLYLLKISGQQGELKIPFMKD